MCQTAEGLRMDHRDPDPPLDKDDILLCVGSIHDGQAKAAGEAAVTARCETDMLHRDLLEIEASTVTLPPTSTTTASEQQHSHSHSAPGMAQEPARFSQSKSGETPPFYLSSAAPYMHTSSPAPYNHLSTDSEAWVQDKATHKRKPPASPAPFAYMHTSPLAHHSHVSTDSKPWAQDKAARKSKSTTPEPSPHQRSDPEAVSGEHDDEDDWSLAAERSQTSDQNIHTSAGADN